MATTIDKKYLSLTRLTEYDVAIKGYVDAHGATTLANAQSYADGLVGNITSGTTVVKEAEHADTADEATHAASATTATSATKATQDENGKNIASTYETKTDASAKLTEAKTYTDTVAAGKSDTSHNHDAEYDAKGAAATAESNAKAYADAAADAVKDDLLNGAGTAYDTLKELGDLIDDNADAIDTLELVAAGKADADHDHAIADVTGLQAALDAKAASSHGTHVTWATTAPKMDGTAAVGSVDRVAREDHVHPTDTSRASQADLDALDSVVAGKSDSEHTHSAATTSAAGFMTADMVIKLNGIATGATNVTVDTALSSTSTNPVQNKAINSAITTLTSTIGTNTAAISANTAAIAEFEEITSAEIQALFA